jgi:hypothetical protein
MKTNTTLNVETPKGKILRILVEKKNDALKKAGEYALSFIRTNDETDKIRAMEFCALADGFSSSYDIVAGNI